MRGKMGTANPAPDGKYDTLSEGTVCRGEGGGFNFSGGTVERAGGDATVEGGRVFVLFDAMNDRTGASFNCSCGLDPDERRNSASSTAADDGTEPDVRFKCD